MMKTERTLLPYVNSICRASTKDYLTKILPSIYKTTKKDLKLPEPMRTLSALSACVIFDSYITYKKHCPLLDKL